MNMITPTQHTTSWYMDPDWCRMTTSQEPWVGPHAIALAKSSVKGVPSLITPPWALHSEWEVEGSDQVREALEKQERALVVIDFPLGESCTWKKPWHVQENHTRILRWNPGETGLSQWPKHRLKQVRKANSKGITIELSENIEEVLALHQMARKRKSIASDEAALRRLFNFVLNSPHQTSLIARDDQGNAIANAIILHNRGRSIYAFGGQKRSALSSLATVSLLHKAIEIAANMGQLSFDFGGSRDHGVDRFYAEFGAEKVCKQRAIYCRKPQQWWLKVVRPDLFA